MINITFQTYKTSNVIFPISKNFLIQLPKLLFENEFSYSIKKKTLYIPMFVESGSYFTLYTIPRNVIFNLLGISDSYLCATFKKI